MNNVQNKIEVVDLIDAVYQLELYTGQILWSKVNLLTVNLP